MILYFCLVIDRVLCVSIAMIPPVSWRILARISMNWPCYFLMLLYFCVVIDRALCVYNDDPSCILMNSCSNLRLTQWTGRVISWCSCIDLTCSCIAAWFSTAFCVCLWRWSLLYPDDFLLESAPDPINWPCYFMMLLYFCVVIDRV